MQQSGDDVGVPQPAPPAWLGVPPSLGLEAVGQGLLGQPPPGNVAWLLHRADQGGKPHNYVL